MLSDELRMPLQLMPLVLSIYPESGAYLNIAIPHHSEHLNYTLFSSGLGKNSWRQSQRNPLMNLLPGFSSEEQLGRSSHLVL